MEFRNILIFRIGHLGDTVVALPAFWALRRRFPTARLSLLTNVDNQNPGYVSPASVLPGETLLDDFIEYPTNLKPWKYVLELRKLRRKLRKRNFDALFYLMPRARTAKQVNRDRFFFRLAGIPTLLGSEFLLKNPLPKRETGSAERYESEAGFLLRMLADAGIESSRPETDLVLTESEINRARDWLGTSVTVSPGARLIAVGPGAKSEAKTWNEERFFSVVSELLKNYDCHPVVFGGQSDQEIAIRLIDRWGRGSNAAGVFSVRESAVILQMCALYLGNDTGTMHLAAAVGTPCVAVFSGADLPGRWDPFGGQNRIFRSTYDCPGCEPGHCRNNKRCLKLIDADEVYRACSAILSDSARSDERSTAS